jgi:hypothetical protein
VGRGVLAKLVRERDDAVELASRFEAEVVKVWEHKETVEEGREREREEREREREREERMRVNLGRQLTAAKVMQGFRM